MQPRTPPGEPCFEAALKPSVLLFNQYISPSTVYCTHRSPQFLTFFGDTAAAAAALAIAAASSSKKEGKRGKCSGLGGLDGSGRRGRQQASVGDTRGTRRRLLQQ